MRENTLETSLEEMTKLYNLQANIRAIHAEIKAIRADMKMELNNFHDNFSKDIKRDLTIFREDINRKFSEIAMDLKEGGKSGRGGTSGGHGGLVCRS